MTETPFFFHNGDYSLFGILHEPEGPTTRPPMLFCHPFGEEKLWTHRVYVAFARQLAVDGCPVLRFDYMGSGDSDGSFSAASFRTIQSDVRCAITELRRRTQSTTIGLLGLRLGATIAASVAEAEAEAGSPIGDLVLWAPVVDAGRYMQELLRINLTTQMATFKEIRHDREALVALMREGGTVNVDGYEMTLPFYEEFSGVTLTEPAEKKHAGRCLIVQVDPQPRRPMPELEKLATTYRRGTLLQAQEEPFWKEIARFYDRAPRLFAVTVEHLWA